jgi:MFS family permease
MFGAISFMPLFVQGALGASATNSGLVTMPMMVGLVLASTASGQVVSRLGRYRLLVLTGVAITAAGMFLLSRMDASTTTGTATVNMVVMGVGLGMSMPVLGLVVQNALPYRLLGVASASTQFFRQVGGLMGVAVFGTLMNTNLRAKLGQSMPETVGGRVPGELLAPLQDARVLLQPETLDGLQGRFVAALAEDGIVLFAQALAALREALAESLAPLFFIGFVLSVLGLAMALFLPELPLRRSLEEEPASLRQTGMGPRPAENPSPYPSPAASGEEG